MRGREAGIRGTLNEVESPAGGLHSAFGSPDKVAFFIDA
jgi:hypothetical protein